MVFWRIKFCDMYSNDSPFLILKYEPMIKDQPSIHQLKSLIYEYETAQYEFFGQDLRQIVLINFELLVTWI